MTMKTTLLIAVLAAAMFQSTFATTTLSCNASFIEVTTTDTALLNKYLRILAQECTPALMAGGTTQVGTLTDATCAVPAVGTTFTLAFTEGDTTVESAVIAHGNCPAQTEETVSILPTATIAAATTTLINELTAGVTMTATPTAPTLGQTLTVVIQLDSDSQEFYRMQLTTLTVTSNGVATNLVTAGCNATTDYSLTVTGTLDSGAPTTVTVTFNAFVSVTSNTFAASTTLTIAATVKLCTSDFSSCYDATACTGSNPQYGRKKRQSEEINTRDLETQVVVFTQEGSREDFMENIRNEFGLTDATKITSEDNICVHKTTSAVILVVLIVGMVLCMLATCFMFIKLRKSRRLENPDKSEFAYSNKSVKH